MNGRWTLPEGLPNLAEDKLQLWKIDLGESGQPGPEVRILLHQAYSVLTPEERDRAARIRVGAPREEFIAGRGCLRRLLGSVLETDPRALVLEQGEHRKPRLRSQPGQLLPDFNVSHSHGAILIGLSTVGEIGVDVEFIDPAVELYEVARTAFHPEDLACIQLSATRSESLTAFYSCWTRKEAIAKADGRGLILEPTSFAAGSATGPDAGTVHEITLLEPLPPKTFYVRGIPVGRNYLAALASVVREPDPCCYALSPRFPLLFADE